MKHTQGHYGSFQQHFVLHNTIFFADQKLYIKKSAGIELVLKLLLLYSGAADFYFLLPAAIAQKYRTFYPEGTLEISESIVVTHR
jgi:hypothetical protein